MDYIRARDNLSRILTDEERFSEINKSIFDAIDTDNSGTLEKDEVETFIKDLLRSMSLDSSNNLHTIDQSFIDDRYRSVFGLLDENESGEITMDELGKFLRELFKEQIKEIQEVIERDNIRKAAGIQGRGSGSF
jgi:Ca2+-binding EF-hand superfamily protein